MRELKEIFAGTGQYYCPFCESTPATETHILSCKGLKNRIPVAHLPGLNPYQVFKDDEGDLWIVRTDDRGRRSGLVGPTNPDEVRQRLQLELDWLEKRREEWNRILLNFCSALRI